MRSSSQARVSVALLAASLLLACQQPLLPEALQHPQIGAWSMEARLGRERAMNTEWQNHTLAELLAAKGRPMLVLQIPGGGNPPGFVVVFGVDAASGCVDSFAVSHEPEARVRIYHCR